VIGSGLHTPALESVHVVPVGQQAGPHGVPELQVTTHLVAVEAAQLVPAGQHVDPHVVPVQVFGIHELPLHVVPVGQHFVGLALGQFMSPYWVMQFVARAPHTPFLASVQVVPGWQHTGPQFFVWSAQIAEQLPVAAFVQFDPAGQHDGPHAVSPEAHVEDKTQLGVLVL